MSYTFIVEDGTIVQGANSYVAVADADDYLTQNIHVGPTWEALGTYDKQKLLSWASRYIDQRATWNGTTAITSVPSNEVATWAVISATGQAEQPMRWPRTDVKDVDGRMIGKDEIPTQLKHAVMEMARYLITVDRSVERDQDQLTELKVDVILMKFRDGYSLPRVPIEIGFMLRGLGTIPSGRTNFSRIRKS